MSGPARVGSGPGELGEYRGDPGEQRVEGVTTLAEIMQGVIISSATGMASSKPDDELDTSVCSPKWPQIFCRLTDCARRMFRR
jgi:hypothetical protein